MAELLARTSSCELAEWIAYAQIEPLAAERADRLELLLGQLLTLMANVNRDRKQRSKPYELIDFMPWLRSAMQPRQQTWQHQLAIVEALNAAMGGEDLRHSK